MVQKRYFWEGGEEGSDVPNRDSKRRNASIRDMNKSSMQELVIKLEPFLRNCVSQEVQRAINSYLRSPLNQIGSSEGSRNLQLHLDDELPSTLFTGCRVEKEDSTLVKVVLRDSMSKRVITSGPLSSIKVTIVVLDGDFNKDDKEDWTQQEFNKRIIRERAGKRPLVTGAVALSLREGMGYIEDVSFTDNSSWIRSGKFRLGAISSEGSIREGMSNAFKVKDHRGESYKKHHPPSSDDEVWRLEKIAKDGASHKRLTSHGIHNVKGLLQLYVSNPCLLRHILGGNKISSKAWNSIIEHATTCPLDNNELYLYKTEDGTVLVLNSIYDVVGANFDGEHYLSVNMFNKSEELLVDNLKRHVYKNLNYLVPLGDQSFVAHPLLPPNLHTGSYCSPSIQNVSFQVGQDQVGMQVNPGHMEIAPAHTCGVQDSNQFKVSGAGTSHQMDAINSVLNSGFGLTNSYDEIHTGGGHSWDSPGSLGLFGLTDQLVLNNNFPVDTSAWQENGFLMAPGNQAFGVVSSGFGIGIPSNGKPKACWCKIRAVIKWRMVKSSRQKSGKAFKRSIQLIASSS
ncbi:calmodulin-binding protein 60 B-like [Coffea arabica]|uniref:Calmodulin-binding protein 60 B-like n=1 Tax=Coffea arabica TaxID=13443 RepID=A0A6P6VXR1_COFAR|nr:calmodulin-binding protein 60 D-like [Coffea arabica]